MLELKQIVKNYQAGNTTVHALKGVDLRFRKSEFVSILGPSGCGKTTLLNIIGGLDQYTSGDLVINGVSTKDYKDRDWDTYRNHSIGFIFQSYHLIPHQTILQNVELALTISGVSKEERRQRAIEALEKVGLADKIKSRPNQLSGGQAQRVAIARALINDPEIVLADEPTGALDSKTSVQIMDLLKEISKDRLIIMVTHNPELAEQYSTRIIKLWDGEVTDDSMPFSGETPNVSKQKVTATQIQDAEPTPHKTNKGKKKKTSMSMWTAFKLSLKNLLSKSKRTAMVSFAGSIGIIGVSMVLAISAGVTNYIADMEDDMLSGNPVAITETALNMTDIMARMTTQEKKEALKIEDGYINVNNMVDYLYKRGEVMDNMFVSNEITEEYINYVKAMPSEYYSAINYKYNLDVSNNLYTNFKFTNHEAVMSLSAARTLYTAMLKKTEFAEYASYITRLANTFSQLPGEQDFILSQYEFLTSADKSKVPNNEDEIILVVNDQHELTDLLLAQLGYFTQEEFFNIVYKVSGNSKYDPTLDVTSISYDDLLNKTFTWYPNNTVYNKTPSDEYVDVTGSPVPLPKSMINPFTYNPIAQDTDKWNSTGKELKITGILIRKEGQNYGSLSSGFYYTPAFAQAMVDDGTSANCEITQYLIEHEQDSFTSGPVVEYKLNENTTLVFQNYGIKYDYEYDFEGTPYKEVGFVGNVSAMADVIGGFLGIEMPTYYTVTLRELGGCELPNEIDIYPVDFNLKDSVTDYLDAWNGKGEITVNGEVLTADDRAEIIYSDTVGIIIAMINTMIEMITIALVAFTALSLVVSTVMVGIITYVSVVERVKEIGILRAVGARKKDIKRLFNAETFIIGLAAGLMGIAVTYLLSLVLNLIIGSLAGIYTIAALPIWQALIMVMISIVLTLISGLIPAAAAAKKDPVVALRTE